MSADLFSGALAKEKASAKAEVRSEQLTNNK